MNKDKSNRTGFTKTGFTKAGFGCCSHFNFCEMGKLKCFYEVRDPEVQNFCAAFLRNHCGQNVSNEKVVVVNPENEETKSELPQNEDGQLSFF